MCTVDYHETCARILLEGYLVVDDHAYCAIHLRKHHLLRKGAVSALHKRYFALVGQQRGQWRIRVVLQCA